MLPRLTLSAALFLQFRQVGSTADRIRRKHLPLLTYHSLSLFWVLLSEGCELDQMRYGCRIYNAQCSCGYGCKSEYRYNNNDDCKLALKGRRSDICSRSKPCLNEGSCSQISSEPGFKCRCEGTGFYGTYCETRCPQADNLLFQGQFPYECVII